MRLDKFLANMLPMSRKEVKEAIRKKQVRVNGSVVKAADLAVNEADEVYFIDRPVKYEKYEYYLLYKPAGYLSAVHDDKDKVIMELLVSKRKDLVPVGRLDKDTEGLILITNDGQLNHQLLNSDKRIAKKYYVETDRALPSDASKRLSEPIVFKEFVSLPAVFEKIADNKAYLTIFEGKYHQVRRMFNTLGVNVTYLKRVSFAFLDLRGLECGQYRKLEECEVEKLKEEVGK